MDVDLWAARLHRHMPSVQSARLGNSGTNRIVMGDEEVRAWFPCPFCYVEIEVAMLCVHLQEEHCFNLKNAVCPICAANLGRDVLSHFTVHHSHSVKVPPFHFDTSVSKDGQKEVALSDSATSDAESCKRSYADEVEGQDYMEMMQRAVFVQEILSSAICGEVTRF